MNSHFRCEIFAGRPTLVPYLLSGLVSFCVKLTLFNNHCQMAMPYTVCHSVKYNYYHHALSGFSLILCDIYIHY